MATLIDGWKTSIEVCPSCLYDVKPLAIRHVGGWTVKKNCVCKKIDEDIAWPFMEVAMDTDAEDFYKAGFDVQIDEGYIDLLESADEEYMDEVDHGWENSYL